MAGDEDLEGQENDAQKIKRMMEKMESMTKTIEELRSNQPKVACCDIAKEFINIEQCDRTVPKVYWAPWPIYST